MSTTETTNLNLPYILAAQAQKHLTHNDAIRALDALVQMSVRDRDLTEPPASPADGDRYIVAAGAGGAWSGHSGHITAFQDDAWMFYTPRQGWRAWVADEGIIVVFNGSAWVVAADPAGTATGLIASHLAASDPHPVYLLPSEAAAALAGQAVQSVAQLGINATADATNKLSVSSGAILFNHAGAGIQEKFNKNAATDTASMLFQTGFSGRAEVGTTGDDNLHVKVSPDGSSWKDALVLDRSSGAATFAYGSGQTQVDVFTASGTWTKPAWARRVEIIGMGGGAGGSSGRRGAAATERRGGGGGAGAGIVHETYLAGELGATLTVTIAIGGAGGAAVTANDTNGNAGSGGGNSLVADGATTIWQANGGLAGTGGGNATAGVGGSGWISTYGSGNGGGSATSGAGGGSPYWGGARSASGGGAGGSLSTGNATAAGGYGASGYFIGGSGRQSAQANGGNAGGGAGTTGNAKAWQRGCGSGGGGGGSGDAAGTVAGGSGGAGGAPGGGGGGGGGSTNGANSGAGGAGARGEVWIISCS